MLRARGRRRTHALRSGHRSRLDPRRGRQARHLPQARYGRSMDLEVESALVAPPARGSLRTTRRSEPVHRSTAAPYLGLLGRLPGLLTQVLVAHHDPLAVGGDHEELVGALLDGRLLGIERLDVACGASDELFDLTLGNAPAERALELRDDPRRRTSATLPRLLACARRASELLRLKVKGRN